MSECASSCIENTLAGTQRGQVVQNGDAALHNLKPSSFINKSDQSCRELKVYMSFSVCCDFMCVTEKQKQTPPLLPRLMRNPAESVFSTIVDTMGTSKY